MFLLTSALKKIYLSFSTKTSKYETKNFPPPCIKVIANFRRMQFNFPNFLFLIVLVLLSGSCTKNILEQKLMESKAVDPAKIHRTPSSPKERLLIENLEKVTIVLKELYKDNSNLKVVNAALFSKAYTDQSVLLKDLIYPDNSRLGRIPKFKLYCQKYKVSLATFSKNFWSEVAKMKDLQFDEFLRKLDFKSINELQRKQADFQQEEQVSIYFPYMEDFEEPVVGGGTYYAPVTSIVTATADADEAWGNQPYYVNGVFQYYKQVLVNDDYAEKNPTQIVGVNGIEPYYESDAISYAFPPGPPIDLPNFPREVKQLKRGIGLIFLSSGMVIGNRIIISRTWQFMRMTIETLPSFLGPCRQKERRRSE